MENRKNTAKANERAAFQLEYSGQLPFLGLSNMPAFYPFPSLTPDHAGSRRRFCRNAQEMLLWFAGENGLITGVSSLECTVIEIPLHSRSNFHKERMIAWRHFMSQLTTN